MQNVKAFTSASFSYHFGQESQILNDILIYYYERGNDVINRSCIPPVPGTSLLSQNLAGRHDLILYDGPVDLRLRSVWSW